MGDMDHTSSELNHTVDTVTTLDKIVPKFCTTIQIALLNDKNLILSMLYNEGKNNVSLIDRVAIDIQHAASLYRALGDLLKDTGYDTKNDQ